MSLTRQLGAAAWEKPYVRSNPATIGSGRSAAGRSPGRGAAGARALRLGLPDRFQPPPPLSPQTAISPQVCRKTASNCRRSGPRPAQEPELPGQRRNARAAHQPGHPRPKRRVQTQGGPESITFEELGAGHEEQIPVGPGGQQEAEGSVVKRYIFTRESFGVISDHPADSKRGGRGPTSSLPECGERGCQSGAPTRRSTPVWSIVRRSPSLSSIVGSQLSRSMARLMSGRRCCGSSTGSAS
jgi:hypothetical protein